LYLFADVQQELWKHRTTLVREKNAGTGVKNLRSGALYIISNFYTRTEVATRIAILYTGNILATAFAGLIAAGIFELDGVRGMAGWRWLFIIQGMHATCFLLHKCGTADWQVPSLVSLLFAPGHSFPTLLLPPSG
jgi:MFS family permease